MTDMQVNFQNQALWQRRRADLAWPEKIRQAEIMREAILQLRTESPATATKLSDPESSAAGS